jgi:hypothetical protein
MAARFAAQATRRSDAAGQSVGVGRFETLGAFRYEEEATVVAKAAKAFEPGARG